MTESYTLIEMEPDRTQTMPPMPSRRSAWLHAAVDSEDGGVIVACSYPVVSERDVPKREVPSSADWMSRVQGVPRCLTCVAAIEAIA